MSVPRTVLDKDAQAYANLLIDPCNAPLSHPIYAGSDGGYLGRYEADFTPQVGAGSTAGAVVFCPGVMSSNTQGVVSTTSVNATMRLGASTTVMTDSGISYSWQTCSSNAYQPGYFALSGVARAVRPVAACLQFYYVGSELNRSGVVGVCRVNGGSVLSESTTSVDNCIALCNMVNRTPDDYIEVKWSPGDGDQMPTDPSVNSALREAEKKNAILVAWRNLPADTVRIRLVVVYEWQPRAAGQGMLANFGSRAQSVNTLDHVINAVERIGTWWYHNSGRTANAVGTLYKAYQVLGGNPTRARLMG